MKGKFGRTAFVLLLFCLMILLYALSSYFLPMWRIIPPRGTYGLLGMVLASFFIGIIGFKEIANWHMALRSWVTVVVSFIVSVLMALGLLIQTIFTSGQTLLETTLSPNKQYVINLYVTNGGATTSYGVVGELNGLLWFKKPIYTDYKINYANVEWMNNYTVSINGHVLNLRKGETYYYAQDPNWEKNHG